VRAAVARQPVVELTLPRITRGETLQILHIFIITAAPRTQYMQPLIFQSFISQNKNLLSRQYILKGKKEPLIYICRKTGDLIFSHVRFIKFLELNN